MPRTPTDMVAFKKHMENKPKLEPKHMKCPHPMRDQESGYGLAGGGMGLYTYCGLCGEMLSKIQDKG